MLPKILETISLDVKINSMYFTATLYAVLIMYIVGTAGFILKKTGALSEKVTQDLSKILICICQPCLIVYSFDKCPFSSTSVKYLLITFITVSLLILISILIFYFIFRKKYEDVDYRIYTFGASVSNYAFFGIPVLQAVFPDKISDLLIISATSAVALNLIGWTIASYIISGDKRYISVKKILLNPSLIGFTIALLLFVLKINLIGNENDFISQIGGMVESLSKMTTPVFMLVLGARLASSDLKGIFGNLKLYIVCFIKQIISPLVVFVIFYFIPVDVELEQTLFVLFACPVASVVLNYAEMVGKGQSTAANLVLLSVLSSIITLPLMTFMLNLF